MNLFRYTEKLIKVNGGTAKGEKKKKKKNKKMEKKLKKGEKTKL